MTTLARLALVAAGAAALAACKAEPAAAPATPPDPVPASVPAEVPAADPMVSATFTLGVEGMSWAQNCASLVQKTLKAIPGVENATVDFKGKTATVKAKGIDAKALVSAVNAIDGGDRFTATLK